ncbi:MAG: hypothetical protein L6277_10915 [Desulfobacterales bacterium]|nr:hypothetical protein [Pseudomonadota bacterium]MBU4354415.1 hypothetical protein [Pseudomonadota bacterium]MCG2772584.1 hypothetical protein [Desulfobacterales bacterium]
MDYAEIKIMAKEQKVRVTDLIVLAPANDPFYVGTDGDTLLGNWFYELWQRFNYNTGVHIRRVHYQIVSQKARVLMPNGMAYENTDQCWKLLGQAAKNARYLGLVDPLALDDRRNPAPMIFAEFAGEYGVIGVTGELDYSYDLSLPYFPDLPDYELSGFVGEQDYLVEVWAEKSTMNDVLVPLCRGHHVNLVTGLGELSITAVALLVERIATTQKPTRILYVSDFDPAGLSMPVAVARKLEFLIQDQDHDVQLHPVVLSRQQTIDYALPRTPIKDTERRKNGFENQHGQGATELDALEALHPGELRTILTGYIRRYYDTGLDSSVMDAKVELYDELEAIRGEVLSEFEPEIEQLRHEYKELRTKVNEQMSGYQTRARQLWHAISAELKHKMPDLENFPVPEPKEANEIDGALFDSNRDYFEQLTAYREWRNGGPGEQERQNDLV